MLSSMLKKTLKNVPNKSKRNKRSHNRKKQKNRLRKVSKNTQRRNTRKYFGGADLSEIYYSPELPFKLSVYLKRYLANDVLQDDILKSVSDKEKELGLRYKESETRQIAEEIKKFSKKLNDKSICNKYSWSDCLNIIERIDLYKKDLIPLYFLPLYYHRALKCESHDNYNFFLGSYKGRKGPNPHVSSLEREILEREIYFYSLYLDCLLKESRYKELLTETNIIDEKGILLPLVTDINNIIDSLKQFRYINDENLLYVILKIIHALHNDGNSDYQKLKMELVEWSRKYIKSNTSTLTYYTNPNWFYYGLNPTEVKSFLSTFNE